MENNRSFFFHKAQEYLKGIDTITGHMIAPYPDINAYLQQQREIIAIRLGVEGLLCEFEQDRFLKECEQINRSFPTLWQKEELLQHYKMVLLSFLNYLHPHNNNNRKLYSGYRDDRSYT